MSTIFHIKRDCDKQPNFQIRHIIRNLNPFPDKIIHKDFKIHPPPFPFLAIPSIKILKHLIDLIPDRAINHIPSAVNYMTQAPFEIFIIKVFKIFAQFGHNPQNLISEPFDSVSIDFIREGTIEIMYRINKVI